MRKRSIPAPDRALHLPTIRQAIFVCLAICLALAAFIDTLSLQMSERAIAAARRGPAAGTTVPQNDPAAIRSGLRAEPLQAGALRQLALQPDLQESRGLELLLVAERISRRDPTTQLILLNVAASQDRVAQVLAHYDVLLATRPVLWPMLQPKLAAALSSPPIARQVAAFGQRAWFAPFLAAAAPLLDDPRTVSQIALRTGQFADARNADIVSGPILRALVAKGRMDEAVQIAERVVGKDKAWMEFGLNQATFDERLAPLTWMPAQGRGAAVELLGSGKLSITVEPLVNMVLLHRTTRLVPGSHLLELTLLPVEGPAAAFEWLVTCTGTGTGAGAEETVLWRQQIHAAPDRQTARLTIPATCPSQHWTLRTRGPDAQTASTVILGPMAITRP